MNANSVIVHNLNVLQLEELLKSTVKEQFDNFKKSLPDDKEELLTREETFRFLKVDSSTLWHWTKDGKLNCYGIGNRRYYKKSEVLECLTLLKN